MGITMDEEQPNTGAMLRAYAFDSDIGPMVVIELAGFPAPLGTLGPFYDLTMADHIAAAVGTAIMRVLLEYAGETDDKDR